jgi:uncharacterized protein YbcI
MTETTPIRDEEPVRVAIGNAVASCMREYTGRGPVAARVVLDRDAVFVILRDALTKGERVLVEHGEDDEVLRIRRTFQQAMSTEVSARIVELTGREVEAFMSTNSTDPDISIEIFMLGERVTPA